MKDTDREPEHEDPGAPPRPAWVDEQAAAVAPGARRERPGRLPRQPVPGRHDEDGLWEHALVTGGLVILATWLAAVIIPHSVELWMITLAGAAVTAAAGYTVLNLAGSLSVAAYFTAWGALLTGWITWARLAGPWHGRVIFALLLPALVLVPAGVTVIRRHRDRVRRAVQLGRDTAQSRECRHWEDLLPRLRVHGVAIRDVIRAEGGYQVHCRLGKIGGGGGPVATRETLRDLPQVIAQHKRLPTGAVYIEEEPAGGSAADFIIHVRTVTGPRLARYLPAENRVLSINRPFGLGVLGTGREFCLKLREVVVFICGLRGSGKSTLLNVLTAQLARCPDALIFMIDLKGGQEARAWLMPWIQGLTGRPVIDWLATTREEAKIMLDALWLAGTARAESGKYGRKLRPSPEAPAIIVICDETAVMTGHFINEGGVSNLKLAVRLVQIAETFRSVAIDPVVAAVRAVVDTTGNSGLKAMAEVRIGMRVATAHEGQQIFPDNLAAAKQLAQLKDRGMGIPQVGPELSPPVHFYNITDGTPDDDGHPTEDRITPIVMAVSDRRPQPEQLVRDAMNTVRVTVDDEDTGVYDARWQLPHIRQLVETWRQEAGLPDLPPQPAPPGQDGIPAPEQDDVPGEVRDAFDDLVSRDPELRSLDLGLDDGGDDEDRALHPVRKRLRQLLIERGPRGYQSGMAWHLLLSEGHSVSRETVCRWLAKDEKLGYVYRTGKPRSRWIWRLPPGAEFDIPGMSD